MEKAPNDMFLSSTQNDRLALYREIQRVQTEHVTAAQKLAVMRSGQSLFKEINVKRLAMLMNRNYGSVYSRYNDLIAVLKDMTGKTEVSGDLFAPSIGELRMFLVKKELPFDFLKAVVTQSYTSADQFTAEKAVSKATLFRHLQPMRQFASAFNVRLGVEDMRLGGDEALIRLFLTVTFWLATDGAQWPFEEVSEETAGKAIDRVYQLFDQAPPTAVSREVAMYYLAVANARAGIGHRLSYDPPKMVLNYPVPNLMAELTDAFPGALHFDGMSLDEQNGESAYLYFLANFSPVYVSLQDSGAKAIIRRFKRYNPEIFYLVDKFIHQLPISMFDEDSLDEGARLAITADLIAVTVSVVSFGADFNERIAYVFSPNVNHNVQDPTFSRKVRTTLEAVFATTPETETLRPYKAALEQAFYANLMQVIDNFQPDVKLKVMPRLEQSALGYVDLIAFLMAQPFVEVVGGDEPLDQVDMVIQAATGPTPPSGKKGEPVPFHWQMAATSDQFGDLYAMLRELWKEKREQAASDSLDAAVIDPAIKAAEDLPEL